MTTFATYNGQVLAIAKYFGLEQNNYLVIPVKTGHINDTYYLQADGKNSPDYVLQQINHHVFRDIENLMENIFRVTTHIASKLKYENPVRSFLRLIPAHDGKFFVRDHAGCYWRCFNYLTHYPIPEKTINTHTAHEGGKALGDFQTVVSDLPGKPLHETIPDFHTLNQRFASFEKALKAAGLERAGNALPEITFFKNHISTLIDFDKQHHIPVRITHNDTKFNNILFDEKGKAICLIDLDTVMNGYVLYDFGDAIRTLANTTCEDEMDVGLVEFRFDLFAAFTRGYLESTNQMLTNAERDLLAFSTKLMTYLIGLRFLTDYLEGDNYYKTSYPDHNLVRTRNQIAFYRKLEENNDRMAAFIRECCPA